MIHRIVFTFIYSYNYLFVLSRVYHNSPSEHKITNVGSQNCDIILWKENLPDTGILPTNILETVIIWNKICKLRYSDINYCVRQYCFQCYDCQLNC